MKTHADMTEQKAWQKCQAGHERHERILVDTELGKMWVFDWDKYKGFDGYCTGQDDISRTLKLYGVWEPAESKVIRGVLEAGDRSKKVLDIGAHIGWYSLMAARMGYQVMAIEADSENCELLKLNAQLHGIKVAGTQAPEITIYNFWIDQSKKDIQLSGDFELVKIDIEGAEQHAIKMIESSFTKGHVQNLFMEISPVFNDSYPALVEKLRGYGYMPHLLDGTLFFDDFNFAQDNFLFKRAQK